MSVRIDYGGVAVGAKEDFVPYITDKADFVDLSELQQDGLNFPNFGNPCDLYSVALDGSVSAFPSDTDSENLGWWSGQISSDDGTFETPIIATFSSIGLYTSSGITLTFDTYNGIYATEINIKWFKDDTLLSDMDFSPDSAFYVCSNKVEFYNKLIITIKSINMPYNRLKLRSIEYGMRISFYGDELRNAKIIQEVDPISTQIAINTCDFTLESKRNIEFSFQERQPLTIYFNDELRATSFVKTAKRKSKNTWSIQSEDYIGLLDSIPYYGGIYTNANAISLLEDIFNVAKVPYSINGISATETVTGYIPYTTCRDALMQVVFAIVAIVDTSNSDTVNIYRLDDTIKQSIPLNRIMQGQAFEDETRTTAVEVTSHTYKAISDEITVYDATESGTGENIFVTFNEPLHGLSITNGEIVSSGTNYAIINANSECILTGKKYDHITTVKSKNNPLVLASDIDNIVSVQNATLVSNANIDKVLEKCYNYYVNNNVVNLKIVEGKHEDKSNAGAISIIYDELTKVGEYIECETEYLGNAQGVIAKQTYNLNGNIIIKDTQIKKGVLTKLPDDEDVVKKTYSITKNLISCQTTDTTTEVEEGASYSATFTKLSGGGSFDGYVIVTMGGVEITNDVATTTSSVSVNIPAVTGDVVITVDFYGTRQFTVTNKLSACSTDNTATAVKAGSAYTATIMGVQIQGFYFRDEADFEVTMGGVDITSDVVYYDSFPSLTLDIDIPEVTGDIHIKATAH